MIIRSLLSTCCSIPDNTIKSSTTAAEGYIVDSADKNSSAAVTSTETLECPSTNVVRIKYKCPGSSNTWTDCTKSHCCPGYNLIDGKCISKDIDPCDLNLCEQRCSFILRKVVCTCWDGYKFNAERQKRGEVPTCIDIDECSEGLDDCEQICINKHGGYTCDCEDEFTLRLDNKTCVRRNLLAEKDYENGRCLISCDTVIRLQNKVSRLEEKLGALETAMTLSMHQLSGPPGSPGPPGPRGGTTSCDKFDKASAAYSDDHGSKAHSILDSYVQTEAGYCKCQRGPIVNDTLIMVKISLDKKKKKFNFFAIRVHRGHQVPMVKVSQEIEDPGD